MNDLAGQAPVTLSRQQYEQYLWLLKKLEYDKLREQGEQYQDWVVDRSYDKGMPIIGYSSKKWNDEKGENRNQWEIKLDRKFRNTDNLYIEFAEKRYSKTFVPSGIDRDSLFYIIGDYHSVFCFQTQHLRWLRDEAARRNLTEAEAKKQCLPYLKETETSKALLLPMAWAENNVWRWDF